MSHKLFALFAVVAVVVGAGAVSAAEPEEEAANAAVEHIRSLQNEDGGFPSFEEESAAGATLDAVFALLAAGVDPLDVTHDGSSPAEYLAVQADVYSTDAGSAAKLTLGVALMGLDVSDFGGTNGGLDLPSVLEGHFDETVTVYGLDTFDEALYLLALAAIGESVRESAFDHLVSMQNEDGGWPFFADDDSDQNTTAISVQALLASGMPASDDAIEGGLDYLGTTQNDDGGFGFVPGEASDPNSTAFAIQALVAAGEDIDEGGPWAPGGNTPLDALLSFRNPETGAFQFFGEDSAFATYQAVPALMLAPFPELETRPDGEPPAMETPVETEAPAPTPTAQPMLPDTGDAVPRTDRTRVWTMVAAAMAAGGLALGAAGVLARRRR